MSLYYCEACYAVRASDEGECGVCGNAEYDEMEVCQYDPDGGGYECDECGESFDTNQGLASHSRVHD